MQREIIGIINLVFDATGQQLIICFAFVKYLRKIGINRSSASALYREKIEKNEMGWECNAYGGEERPIQGFWW
jgi:hypothetical protein